MRYYQDKVKPAKVFRLADEKERAAIGDLVAALKDCAGAVALDLIARKNQQAGQPDQALPVVDFGNEEFLQSIVFAVGKLNGFEPLRDWFKALYEVLLGSSDGPRFGGFIALYGLDESIALIEAGLAGEFVS